MKGPAKAEIHYGFWVGLGFLLVFAVWRLISYAAAKVAGGHDG